MEMRLERGGREGTTRMFCNFGNFTGSYGNIPYLQCQTDQNLAKYAVMDLQL